MRTLISILTFSLSINLTAQSLQESLNKSLEKQQVKSEENSLQTSLNNALKKEEAITSFEANVDIELSAVQLKWEKLNAINSESFIIEKSANREDWEEVATVFCSPHVNQPTEFFHLDDNPSNNLSYYRLISKSSDGKDNISNIVPVNYLKKEGATAGMNLHPDFAEDYKIINIAFEEVFEKEILVVIRDKKGNEFYSKVVINVEDEVLVAVPVGNEIPSGDYLITATSENQIYSQNVTVL